MSYIDISPPIRPESPVFPGDQAFERQIMLDWDKGAHLSLSWIKSTVHIGAHADAPYHYHAEGVSIEKRSLDYYMGPCQVIDVSHVGPRRLLASDINLKAVSAPRVLFRSLTFAHQEPFQENFASLSPELIHELASRDVRLIGIDTPSIDPASAKDLLSHHAIFHHDMAILEGIDLTLASPGLYELIALPLAIEGADASPVRAVLRSL